MSRSVSQAFQSILDIIFPPSCLGCKRGGSVLCSTCLAAIQPLTPPLCQRCGTPLIPWQRCSNCTGRLQNLHGLRVVSLYQEPLRSYIHALKYDGHTRLAQPLGTLLALAYQRYGLHADLIIPVPLHTQRQRDRGYNQSQLLALACAEKLQLVCDPTLLTRVRATSAQVHLSPQERAKNVEQAFRCSQPHLVRNQRILLIDDVCTTGATLAACASPLRQAGAREVWGLALARPMAHLQLHR
jgi:ComF family protein